MVAAARWHRYKTFSVIYGPWASGGVTLSCRRIFGERTTILYRSTAIQGVYYYFLLGCAVYAHRHLFSIPQTFVVDDDDDDDDDLREGRVGTETDPVSLLAEMPINAGGTCCSIPLDPRRFSRRTLSQRKRRWTISGFVGGRGEESVPETWKTFWLWS